MMTRAVSEHLALVCKRYGDCGKSCCVSHIILEIGKVLHMTFMATETTYLFVLFSFCGKYSI